MSYKDITPDVPGALVTCSFQVKGTITFQVLETSAEHEPMHVSNDFDSPEDAIIWGQENIEGFNTNHVIGAYVRNAEGLAIFVYDQTVGQVLSNYI